MEASPFGVYAEDMQTLVELYGLVLKAGHLPQPHTNQLVIPETLARNRGLEIGDLIGDPEHPAYPGANSLPVTFVVSGIFAQPDKPEAETWWGFVSLEFLESHEAFSLPDSLPVFVVAKPGQKESLDDWLESEYAGDKFVRLLTCRGELAREQDELADFMRIMILVESMIAIVAASALAGLHQIFISQRGPEFGVLHALGFSRLRLVGRGLQETVFTTGVAWSLSVILVVLVVIIMRFSIFTPLGLTFDPFDSTPWIYTLPIPVAVLAVTSGSVARILKKLDPVAIIERR